MGRRSRAQSANGIDSANDVTGGVRRISFADVGQGLWIAEDRQSFLELGQVLGAEDDSDRAPVAGDRDALVLVLDTVDDIAEVIADVAKGFNGPAHNCGALTAPASTTKARSSALRGLPAGVAGVEQIPDDSLTRMNW
jgi:hypothetical protein